MVYTIKEAVAQNTSGGCFCYYPYCSIILFLDYIGYVEAVLPNTATKMKFSIKDLFS